jgi:hypothetical protein
MTPEQQRIAIATACGWTAEQDSNGYWRAVSHKHGNAVELWLSERSVWSFGIPDYLNDLNAMHEAEKVLTYEQKRRFVFWLDYLNPSADIHSCDRKNDMRLEVFGLIHATAAKKDEAFLRTLGLWQPTPTQPQ